MSEREPELGLGVVASVDRSRIGIEFPATGEKRLYALGTPVLKRVQFRAGDKVATRDGIALTIETVEEEAGLLVYVGAGRRVREDVISDITSVDLPQERLMAGQVDPGEVFDLRYRALQAQWKFRSSEVRGMLGGRLELIPHQFSILQAVASRQIPRVLLADEVGLGKTIEACLILQRLLAIGKAKRVLILVPESLTHQWFVELLRRFNLWFSIYDEERCLAVEQSDPGTNPFLATQLALGSTTFLAGSPARREQAVAAGWDMVVVDEAHHLEWTPDLVSPEYALVEELAGKCPGLLLLTATPTQLGLVGHFARLRLLDPDRYADFDKFLAESEGFGAVAAIAGKIIEQKPLKPADHASLKKIFNKDPAGLSQHLDALAAGRSGAREALLKTLLDQHGTGRVVFRNTRAGMSGFPKRKFCPVPLPGNNLTLLARIARELEAEETGREEEVRYSFKDDPRVGWLVEFLTGTQEPRQVQRDSSGMTMPVAGGADPGLPSVASAKGGPASTRPATTKPAKVLLICKSRRKVAAIEAALAEKINVKVGQFHEGLPLVQRDRQAAWFAEPDGAQLLICSEIGSEGRNFQFAHHLVLWDLPLNPGLLEQRIGRLDRIGQTETIRVHVPYVESSAEECVLDWYHRGLDAIETSLQGGNDYQDKFKARLLAQALAHDGTVSKRGAKDWEAFIKETVEFREELSLKMKNGRDRLLELNSFNLEVAARAIEQVRAADADPFLRNFLSDLLDHFGVRIKEHEEGDVFLDPSHAYIEGFPSIPHDGMLATFNRQRAIAREDIKFISPDHALVQDAIDLLVDSKSGTTAFSRTISAKPNLLLETIFVLEAVADSRWHVDQFLAPVPVRVLVDVRGNDLTDERDAKSLAAEAEDGDIHRFLESPGFNISLLKALIEGATKLAEVRTGTLKKAAQAKATTTLTADLQRLIDLRKLNDHVRVEEIVQAQEQMKSVNGAIEQARLRLDSIRLIVEGPAGKE